MKELIYKELKLAVHPTMYLFLLLSAMLLIPSYPYYVAFMYTSLAVFFMFLNGRETRDIFYTALLPVKKSDVVKARYLTIIIFELAQIIIGVPFAVISMKINPMGSNTVGIEPNVAFFGLVFVMFAGFNMIFMPEFYKTAYKTGKPLLYSGVFIFVYIFVAEAVANYIPSPVQAYLDTNDPAKMAGQFPVLIAGIAVWAALTYLSYKISARRFEKVDL